MKQSSAPYIHSTSNFAATFCTSVDLEVQQGDLIDNLKDNFSEST